MKLHELHKLNEISASTATSYIYKAAADSHKLQRQTQPDAKDKALNQKIDKRRQGLARAADILLRDKNKNKPNQERRQNASTPDSISHYTGQERRLGQERRRGVRNNELMAVDEEVDNDIDDEEKESSDSDPSDETDEGPVEGEDVGSVADLQGFEKSKKDMFAFGATRPVTLLTKQEREGGMDVTFQYVINPKTGAWSLRAKLANQNDSDFVEFTTGEDPSSLIKSLKKKKKVTPHQLVDNLNPPAEIKQKVDKPKEVDEEITWFKKKDRGQLAHDNVLDSTDEFQHWKKIVKDNYPKATFTIHPDGCTAMTDGRRECGEWNLRKKYGTVLHVPTAERKRNEA